MKRTYYADQVENGRWIITDRMGWAARQINGAIDYVDSREEAESWANFLNFYAEEKRLARQ